MATENEPKLDNVRDLRDRLKEVLRLALANKIDDARVKRITSTSAQLLKTCTAEMDYAKMNRTTVSIDFLEPDGNKKP